MRTHTQTCTDMRAHCARATHAGRHGCTHRRGTRHVHTSTHIHRHTQPPDTVHTCTQRRTQEHTCTRIYTSEHSSIHRHGRTRVQTLAHSGTHTARTRRSPGRPHPRQAGARPSLQAEDAGVYRAAIWGKAGKQLPAPRCQRPAASQGPPGSLFPERLLSSCSFLRGLRAAREGGCPD